jgi:hypothetical protein
MMKKKSYTPASKIDFGNKVQNTSLNELEDEVD